MKKLIRSSIVLCILFANQAFADSSHECDVSKIESKKDAILVFVNNCTRVSGDELPTIPQGNGFTNEANGSYLWLARTEVEVQETKHMLSLTLTAFTATKKMVLRWDMEDGKAVIRYIAIK